MSHAGQNTAEGAHGPYDFIVNALWEGRLAFLLKDYIDRKFMKKFQVAGELNEEKDQAVSPQKPK